MGKSFEIADRFITRSNEVNYLYHLIIGQLVPRDSISSNLLDLGNFLEITVSGTRSEVG